MTNLFSYLGYGFFWLLGFLPFRVIYLISDFIYLIVYHVLMYRKEVVNNNLKKSFPEKSEKEIEIIQRIFYSHFCDIFLETIKMMHMSEKEMKKRFVFKNKEVVEEYLSKGKSVIASLGHYGNWEWMGSYSLHSKHPNFNFMAIYKPLSNKVLDRMYIRIRRKFGAKLIPKQDTLRTMIEYKNQDKNTFVLFISDQTPNRNNLNYWTQFLNQETPVLLGTEKIAKKLNQSVVYAEIQKIKRGYYEIEFIPLFDNSKDTKLFEITEKQTRMLEKTIKRNPAYWLWSHKRWKHKR